MKSVVKTKRSVMMFEDFTATGSGEDRGQEVWIVHWPEWGTAGLYTSERAASRAYSEDEKAHADWARQGFVEMMKDDPKSYKIFGTEDDEELEELLYKHFDDNEEPENYGEPPEMWGPFFPKTNDLETREAMKLAATEGYTHVAKSLIENGADAELLLDYMAPKDVISFFGGDVSWIEGPFGQKLQRMHRGSSAFGI